MSIVEQERHWDETWKGRIDKNKISLNIDKYRYILKQLVMRPYLSIMEKLEIGCGTGIHANRMAVFNPLWRDRWTGIDLSEDAVSIANRNGMNAIHGDVYEFDGAGKKYEVFLFLDSLEHFFDHKRLAEKVVELAAKEYIIIGNIPLYSSAHGEGVERPIGCMELIKFFVKTNCMRPPSVKVYGINGFPYMFFETSNTSKDYNKWTG